MLAWSVGAPQSMGTLLLLICLAFLDVACGGGAEDARRFGTGKGMSSVMIGVFLAALAALVLATQSAFVAYLGVAVAKQWPEPKLSGVPYNDRMQFWCSSSEISLYSLNVVLALLWVAALAVYTWVWCDLTGSSGCCTTWVCILVGLIFWMVPGVHVVVFLYMTAKFMELGWPLTLSEAAYVPIPGSIVDGVPDVVPGMPADDTLDQIAEDQSLASVTEV